MGRTLNLGLVPAFIFTAIYQRDAGERRMEDMDLVLAGYPSGAGPDWRPICE